MKTPVISKSPFRGLRDRHAVAVFDNPGHFVDWLEGSKAALATESKMNRSQGFYGRSWVDMLKATKEGDPALAKKSAEAMRKIESVNYATTKRQRVSSPYGRVSTGAYLAGDPMPCRRKVLVPHRHAPLSVVVSLNSMADVPVDLLVSRGVALAAMVRRVAAERPVTLYLSRFSECNTVASCCLIKFPTSPIDTHRLAYLLSCPSFSRGAGFAFHRDAQRTYRLAGMHCEDVHDSRWISFAGGPGYSQRRLCPFQRDLREFLATDLLYIPGSDFTDPTFKAMTGNPAAWINETVAELTAKQEA